MRTLTFTQWYQKTHGEHWNGDYVGLYSFIDDMTREYKDWCDTNQIKPTWDI